MPKHASSGKSGRVGINLMEMMEHYPDERAARGFFVAACQGENAENRICPRCQGTRTAETTNHLYWCPDRRRQFSVRANTPMADSPIPLRKWLFGLYLWDTSLKSMSSMKLHRDLGITQKSAWFMLHRLREGFSICRADPFRGKGKADDNDDLRFARRVSADEMFIGGKGQYAKNGKPGVNRKQTVVGVKDRATGQLQAKVIPNRRAEHVVPSVHTNTRPDRMVYTDESKSYLVLARLRKAVCHSVAEYVREAAHMRSLESFCAG